jgi:hypothetical protein
VYLILLRTAISIIENLWSKFKNILGSIKTTNYQELGKAIEFAFSQVSHKIFGTGLHAAVIVPHLSEKRSIGVWTAGLQWHSFCGLV